MSFIENVIQKLTIREVGFHLSNYSELYSKPLKIWKKSILNSNNGYNAVIYHLIYYCIFLFFLVREVELAIPLAILEAAITVIPFLIFFLPFLAFTKLFKLHYKWNKLFRLFLVIKLQFLPIIFLAYLLSKETETENIYLIIDNLIFLIWVMFIFVFPIIIKLSFWRKVAWVFLNYVFFLIGILLISFLIKKLDNTGKLMEKISNISPNQEFLEFQVKDLYNPELFNDKYYFIHIIDRNRSLKNFEGKPQFVNNELYLAFLQTEVNQTTEKIIKMDSILGLSPNLGARRTKKPRHVLGKKYSAELTLESLDSIKKEVNSRFYVLLNFASKMRDSAKFESNRKYFRTLTNYLRSYEKSYIDENSINEIIENSVIEGSIRFNETNIGVLYKLDSNYYAKTKKKFLFQELQCEKRSKIAGFVFNIVYFPIDFMVGLFLEHYDFEEL